MSVARPPVLSVIPPADGPEHSKGQEADDVKPLKERLDDGRAIFCFDLASPLCYFAAERAASTFAGELEWLPVSLAALPRAQHFDAFRCESEELFFREDVERRANELGLQPLRWPQRFPFDSSLALRAATYAKSIGRGATFTLAAFRQAFAGGHPLEQEDFVLIAAAACEMHPKAVASALASESVGKRLHAASDAAAALGAYDLPAFLVGGEALIGERLLERAAELARKSEATWGREGATQREGA